MHTWEHTPLHPSVATAMEFTQRAVTTQQVTLDRLNAMTGLDWVVNAEPATTITGDHDLYTVDKCANDTNHGPGTVAIPGYDLLCQDCGVSAVLSDLVDGARIDVDVLL